MTSSPLSHPHPLSLPHTPLSISPNSSPTLRPLPSSMVRSASSSGSVTPLNLAASASTTPRSSARAPPVRPYRSALCSRADRIVREVAGDTKDFGDLVVGMVEKRARKARGGNIIDSGGEDARKGRSLGGSLAGSWERERAELIVDIPVWSPGCFQGMCSGSFSIPCPSIRF